MQYICIVVSWFFIHIHMGNTYINFNIVLMTVHFAFNHIESTHVYLFFYNGELFNVYRVWVLQNARVMEMDDDAYTVVWISRIHSFLKLLFLLPSSESLFNMSVIQLDSFTAYSFYLKISYSAKWFFKICAINFYGLWQVYGAIHVSKITILVKIVLLL